LCWPLFWLYLMKVQKDIRSQFAAANEAEVETASVTVGSIQTTVSGSGQLADEEYKEVMLPALLTLDEVHVQVNDTVEKGQLLATVNPQTMISAMAQLQTKLDELDAQLEDAEDETAPSTIKASVPGRVKAIFVSEQADVASTMYEKGALMLLSLDGYMAVDVQTDALKTGDAALIVASDGTEYSGVVEHAAAGKATVLISDDGPVYDDTVVVNDAEGNTLGGGTLYIHKSLAVTGYAGSVKTIKVEENDKVKKGTKLLELTDTDYSAAYDSLIRERETMEADMQALIAIYSEGGIYAPIAGKVMTMSYDEEAEASEEETSFATIRPDETILLSVNVDETNILSLEVGQEATVSVDSISDESFKAKVTEIGTEGTSSGGVTTYAVEMSLTRSEKMRSGMSASANISISAAEEALLLPEDAVSRTSDTYYVYTALNEETNEPTQMKEIEVGVTGNGYVEILSGLSEGDTVYYTVENFRDFGGRGGMNFGGMNFGGMGGNMPDMGKMPDMGERGQNGRNQNSGNMPGMGSQGGNQP